MSKVAEDLIKSIENYIAQSNKTDYEFTEEEQMKVERAILVLNKHIDFLVQYEIDHKNERV